MKSLSTVFGLALTLAVPSLSGASKVARPRLQNLASELVSFSSCKALEDHVNKEFDRQVAVLQQNLDFGGRAGLGQRSLAKKGLTSAMRSDSLAAPPSIAQEAAVMDPGATPGNFVGTNNQVEKVDEADFVKFNGRQIFQLYSGSLRVLKAWPANELNQIGSLSISGNPQEILVNERNAVVLSNDGSTLTASIIDITQPSNPRILTEFKIPGHYRTARLIGDTLRIVNQDYGSIHQYWNELPRSAQSNGWLQEERSRRSLNIQATTQTVGETHRTLDILKDCSRVLTPKDTAPDTLTRIISIDLKEKKYEETLAFIRSDTVYASENAIYLSQGGYMLENNYNQQKTAIHKFGLKTGSPAEYQASGMVNGHLINQFAMDEHKGNLRVATNGTESKTWSWSDMQQVSRIEVLSQKGKTLKSIGRTGDMGKGERLYSVRFDGDKGYVVTFRQVDPLYTVDLSSPSNPRVMGELKIPGFSTYIHMLDDKHLLTIGQDADENTGRVRGLKLSVFDVSNFKKPREVKNLVFKSNVTSESSYEHKAFSFYRQKGILAIPAQQIGVRSSLLLFKVTPSDIKPAGEVAMSEMASAQMGVRRSFFAENIVYAIGTAGVRAANLNNPQTPLATVEFDRANIAESGW